MWKLLRRSQSLRRIRPCGVCRDVAVNTHLLWRRAVKIVCSSARVLLRSVSISHAVARQRQCSNMATET